MTENFKLALIGPPLGHSLSPLLYETAFKSLDYQEAMSYWIHPPRI